MAAIRPRVGRGHVIHCLDAYQGRVGMEEVKTGQRLATTIGGHLRRTTLLPVISDFLFEDAPARISELAELNSVHDVFLVMIDSAFAFELPDVSAGWVSAFDIETGESRLMSRRELRAPGARACGPGRTSLERAGARARPGRAAARRRSGTEPAGAAGIRHGAAAEEGMMAPGIPGIRDWGLGMRARLSRWRCRRACSLRADDCEPTRSAHDATVPRPPRTRRGAVPPIECWWKTDRSAVRVGETFHADADVRGARHRSRAGSWSTSPGSRRRRCTWFRSTSSAASGSATS